MKPTFYIQLRTLSFVHQIYFINSPYNNFEFTIAILTSTFVYDIYLKGSNTMLNQRNSQFKMSIYEQT